ncbi:MAG: dipeptidase [Eubacteriales bacterium]
MYIVDSHCDSIATVGEQKLVNPYNFSGKHRQLQMVAMFCAHPKDTPDDSWNRALHYAKVFEQAMQDERDTVLPVRTYDEIEHAFRQGKHAALLTVEGGLGRNTPENLRAMYEAGVRVFGMTWLSNDMAKSNRVFDDGEEDTGLTDLGRAMVAEGNRLGMLFDVSHISDRSFWELAELSAKPILATHSNFRSLCGHSRNLTDDMARRIVDGDGMIGLNLCTSFIHTEPEQQTVEGYFRHLDYALEHFGEDHIGFGGDIDGIGSYPRPLTLDSSVHDQLIEFMERHNYTENLIEKVAGGNYLRFLKKYL